MKKTILTIMVAAMMLVAFTACEQQMPTYKTPVGMTLQASKTVYLEGEAFDESTLTGVVTYSDGSSDTFTGSQLNYNATSGAATNGVRPLSITAEYGLTGKEVSAQTTVYYYTVAADDITVGNIPTVATSTGTGYKIDLSEVTVTVNVGGETRELVRGTEFTNTDYTDGSGSYTEDTTVEPKGTLTTVSIFGQTGVAVPVPADYEITVVYEKPAVTPGDPSKVTVYYSINDGAWSTTAPTDSTVYYDDSVDVEIRLEDASNNTVKVLSNSDLTRINGSAALVSNYEISDKASTAVQDFLYTYTDEEGNDTTYHVTVPAMPAGEAYASSVSALKVKDAQKQNLVATFVFDEDTDLTTVFEGTVTLNDGKTATDLSAYISLPTVGSDIVDQTIPTGAKTFTLYYDVTVGRPGSEKTTRTSVTFDVYQAPQEDPGN